MRFHAVNDRTPSEIEIFEYPDSEKARPNFWGELKEVGVASSRSPSALPASRPDLPQAPTQSGTDELNRSFAAGRERGIREGRELEEQTQNLRQLEQEKRRIAQTADLTNQFAHERDRFLESIEVEVVRLALAIAERVLRREAQTDPLFLLGAVRVALGQLAENMRVRVRVPSAEAELWAETLLHIANLKVRPEVVPEQGMQPGECTIESEMGSADLGLCKQLQAIQDALLDDSPTSQRTERQDLRRREAQS